MPRLGKLPARIGSRRAHEQRCHSLEQPLAMSGAEDAASDGPLPAYFTRPSPMALAEDNIAKDEVWLV